MPVACTRAVQWAGQIKNYPEGRIKETVTNNIRREKEEKFRVKLTLLKGNSLGRGWAIPKEKNK